MNLRVHIEREIEQLLSIARLQVLPDEGVSVNIKTLYSGFVETIEAIQSIRENPNINISDKLKNIAEKHIWVSEFWNNLILYKKLIGQNENASSILRQARKLEHLLPENIDQIREFSLPNPTDFVKSCIVNFLYDENNEQTLVFSDLPKLKNPKLLDLRFLILLRNNKYPMGAVDLKNFLNIQKCSDLILLKIIEELFYLNELDKIKYLIKEREMITRGSGNKFVTRAIELFVNAKRFYECAAFFDEIHNCVEDKIGAIARFCEFLLLANENVLALEQYKKVKFDNLDANSQSNIAICYWKTGHYDLARIAFKRSLKKKYSYVTLNNYYEFLFQTNKHSFLKKELVNHNHSGFSFANYYLAQLLCSEKKFVKARYHLKEIVYGELTKSQQIKFFELSHNINHAIGNYDQAFLDIKKMNLQIENSTEITKNTENGFIVENKKVSEYLFTISANNKEHYEYAPRFIVGFPRSGTTLIDRMLNEHPEISVIEEKNILEAAIDEALRKSEGLSSIRRCYEDSVLNFKKSNSDVLLIDKYPLNIRFLPFLRQIFPNSKTIVMIRSPIESIFSCYRTSFEMNPAMSLMQSLDDLVELYSICFSDDTISRFKDPDLLIIKYESLIEDTRTTLIKVMEFLEKPFMSEQLEFHNLKNVASVRTPSFNQVNKPIYKSSLEYAALYKKQLRPWLIKLSPFFEQFGYEHI